MNRIRSAGRYARYFPPNWSPAKEGLYWREWSAASKAAKKAGVTLDRHALHVDALGSDKSHTDFNNDDFTKVLAKFREWSAPGDLNSQLKALNGRKVRLIFGIRRTAGKLKKSDAYVLAIAKTQTQRDIRSLDTLDEAELERVRVALAAELRRKNRTPEQREAWLAKRRAKREAAAPPAEPQPF